MATTTTFIFVAAGTVGCSRDVELLPEITPKVCVGGLGTPIRFPTSSGEVCSSALAARGHRFGVCTCDALDLTAPLVSDAMDLTAEVPVRIAGVGAVGSNGPLSGSSSGAQILVDGALHVASGIATTGHIEVARSLRVAGSMIIIGTDVHVAGDAYVAAAISGTLRVDGVLHQTPGFGMDPMLIPEAAIRRETVTVAPPCDCSAGFVDLPTALAMAQVRNDNAVTKLQPDDLAPPPPETLVEVTCGVYSLSSINASELLIFVVHGRTEVAVTGDVVLRGGMAVLLDEGAELDLVIGGRLVASGGNSISTTAPARFRIWIAGTQSVVLDDAPAVGAMIHAPRAAVVASSGLQMSGGLLARSLSAGGPVEVHLDQAVFASGMPCGEPIATPVQ